MFDPKAFCALKTNVMIRLIDMPPVCLRQKTMRVNKCLTEAVENKTSPDALRKTTAGEYESQKMFNRGG